MPHAGQDAERSHHPPLGAGPEELVGPHRITLRSPSQRELCDHDGRANEHHAQEVDEDESRAPTLADLGGESPDITESDRGSCCGQDEAESRALASAIALRFQRAPSGLVPFQLVSPSSFSAK